MALVPVHEGYLLKRGQMTTTKRRYFGLFLDGGGSNPP